jgi:hypothetical protein
MDIKLNLDDVDSYQTFLKVKSLPSYSFTGRVAHVPDEYAHLIGATPRRLSLPDYDPLPGLFDYQRDITSLAIRKRKFAVFADPGLGKSLVYLEYIRYVSSVLPDGQCILLIDPLNVIDQMLGEVARWYEDTLPIERIPARELAVWLTHGKSRIGITNYEALNKHVQPGRLGALVIDESSYLKSYYGFWGQEILRLGRGLQWVLAGTGTPAPNDRTEFANHAILMGRFPTLNAFLARYFVNKGQTSERWVMKPHAIGAFYRELSDWCIFLTNPGTYGWKDNVGGWPPINVHIHDVELTSEQSEIAMGINGTLFPMHVGGITKRSRMGQLSKGKFKETDGTVRDVPTLKFDFIRSLVDSFHGQSCIIWCRYDDEQKRLERAFPDAVSLKGSTSQSKRLVGISDFQAGRARVLISKPKILGFGLNLQIARHHIFSTLQDSYEEFRQCIGRSNRYGSEDDLDVHIPVTDLERPMVETVLRKSNRVQMDAVEQERVFQGSVPGGVYHALA